MKLRDFEIWLDTFLNFEKKQTKGIFWLDSMKFLCEKLNNPQNKIKCIHVAGSKGKGSVSNMIANIVQSHGFTCGIYASPHIVDFRERVCTPNGYFDEMIYENAADILYRTVDSLQVKDLPGERPLTWFEIVTAFAFVVFDLAHVDYAVYETGLGGRLDSTNIIQPLVSVLTPIELEHTQFLGNTISQIAYEKAGIIKPHGICVVAHQNYKNATKVFLEKAKEMESRCILVDDLVLSAEKSFVTDEKSGDYAKMTVRIIMKKGQTQFNFSSKLNLLGQMQLENACTAIGAVFQFIQNPDKEAIEKGLSNAVMSGRFEICKAAYKGKHVCIVFDGAHTKNSIEGSLRTLSSVFERRNVVLLFSCAADKKFHEFIPLFKRRFSKIFATKPGYVRQSDIDGICECLEQNGIDFIREENCAKAFCAALDKASQNDDVLFITGSFYLVAEIKRNLEKLNVVLE